MASLVFHIGFIPETVVKARVLPPRQLLCLSRLYITLVCTISQVAIVCNILVGIFTSIPLQLTVIGLMAHASYFAVQQKFPAIELDGTFVLACSLVVFHNYLTFQHFANVWHTFDDVLGYFTVCVWLVPFGLFVSLSVNDNVLPSTAFDSGGGCVGDMDLKSSEAHGRPHRKKRAGVLMLIDKAREYLGDLTSSGMQLVQRISDRQKNL